MSYSASYVNGELVTTTASSLSLSKATESSGSSVGKDEFLKLLVAQMQYQDPLEPTSNTEWVSQYATFSELEEMQNVSNSMDLMRASGLVGQIAVISGTDSNGNEYSVTGKVDYVVYENSKAYLSIDESLYSIDDLQTIIDEAYLSAYSKASQLVSDIADLPEVDKLTLDDEEAVTAIEETYEGMSEYEKSFIASTVADVITAYVEKLASLKAEESSEDE